ncbi:L-lactate permease [Tautonia sp. JC769]|uniref:L-lactate permease n=1 Tax=Tautonia sp. JC769 TaxID=3232135 RepID=UPI003457FB57
MADVWTQVYDPFDAWPLSTLAASVPVLVLLGLLGSGKASAWQAALAGLASAMAMAIGIFGMPADLVVAGAGVGMVFAFFRIVWLITAAVFLYNIAVETGQFEVMKASIARLSDDRRIQAILVAFSFGAFIEGAAGFGAPVAISAAFLVGLGFRPLQAAILCLVANTAPVAWGAIGTPIRALGEVTSLDTELLSATAGRILPLLSVIVPWWLVRMMVGWRETVAVWPALVVIGGSFAAAQFVWSNFVGYELVDIVSSIASLAAGMLLLRVWKPRQVWHFPEERAEAAEGPVETAYDTVGDLTPARVARAWMPFGLLTIMVILWGIPGIKGVLEASTSWNPPMARLSVPIGEAAPALGWPRPVLEEAAEKGQAFVSRVVKGEAITGRAEPEAADFEKVTLDIAPVASTGTAILIAAILSGVLLGLGPRGLARVFGLSVYRLRWAAVAILCMLGLGFVTKLAGMDAVLGLAFTRTGPWLYPIFGTLLGWLGVALTGSDTASNVLFGNLQRITAEKLGLDPILMASANTTGGVMGKMVDAQSIVVAAAATGEGGREGTILRAVLIHSLALAFIVGGVVWLYAHVFPGLVPGSSAEPVGSATASATATE